MASLTCFFNALTLPVATDQCAVDKTQQRFCPHRTPDLKWLQIVTGKLRSNMAGGQWLVLRPLQVKRTLWQLWRNKHYSNVFLLWSAFYETLFRFVRTSFRGCSSDTGENNYQDLSDCLGTFVLILPTSYAFRKRKQITHKWDFKLNFAISTVLNICVQNNFSVLSKPLVARASKSTQNYTRVIHGEVTAV